MRVGHATGLQIAFLMYAVMLIAVPLSRLLIHHASLTGVAGELVTKGMHFGLAILLIVSVAPLRRLAGSALTTCIPRARRIETAIVTVTTPALAFATAGALAAWFWTTEGPARVERMLVDVDSELARAFSPLGLVRIALSILVAPIVEEVVFRGFIYRAFERQRGWVVAMIATSILFGIYHPYPWSAFAFSIVAVCILRRTGSLRAPIIVHVTFNLLLWWPLLGQHVFPRGSALADPAIWYLQWSCLAFALVALPTYAWMSRDHIAVAPTLFLEPNATLPK